MASLKVIFWALNFIIRIRFPPGKSLATILNNRYNNSALEAFRKFQRLELKLGKAKLDLEFLSTCKKRSVIIPRFLWFKVANRRLRTSSAYRQCQNKLLQDEINANHALIRVLPAQATTTQSRLASLVSNMDFIHLKNVSDRENSRKLSQHQRVKDRKLFRLCSRQYNSNSVNPEAWSSISQIVSSRTKKSKSFPKVLTLLFRQPN